MGLRSVSLKNFTLIVFAMLPLSTMVNAKLRTTAAIDTSYNNNSVQGDDFGERDSSSLVIQPRVGLILETQKLQAFLNVNHRYIEDSSSIETNEGIGRNNKSSLTNYSYKVEVVAVPDILNLSARGNQSYRDVDITNALISNEDFSNSQLAKTKTDALGFDLTLDQSNFMGLQVNGDSTSVTSDESFFLENGLDSQNDSLNAYFYSGPNLKSISWNVNGNYNKTQGRASNDIESRMVNGNLYIGLFSNFRLVGTANSESNIITSTSESEGQEELKYDSYGAGLSWFRSAEQFIDVTYNISSRQDQERDKFLGTRFIWRFSPRTRISGEYGRRFYGESGQFAISYNMRKLRLDASYTEALTTFSRLVAGETINGIFVCPIGATSIIECYLPDSINYELQPGEQFTNLSLNLAELSEESTLRKSFQTSVGYDFRKFSVALTAQSSDFEYVQTSRKQNDFNTFLSLNLEVSKKSSVNWTNAYGKSTRNISDETQSIDDRTLSSTLTYKHTLNRHAKVFLSYQITDKDSPIENRDFTSRRLTLRYSFTFL
ncbi:hypothetical protein GLIP_0678 [Aliiglaciecola lipolytica E3]|uniref:TIGR03016 family PEP-CTERM system-associated outer membrane protein n=1 Tax=Aliiglaciecola lipolytica E3 TaxID=1127673 RepID=K6WY03_9ALTE|nr:hypothetical protein GLIP_0678 [Aliiglaciecola lipolytica E3]